MTPNFDINGACEKIMAQAKDYAKRNYAGPGGLGRATGTLDFLTSPSNGGVKHELVTSNGGRKLRRARVIYKQRVKPCEWSSGSTALAAGLCDTPNQKEDKEVLVDVSSRIAMEPFKVANEKMVILCQDTESFYNEFISSYLRAGREKLDEVSLALIAAGVGKNIHQDGTTTAAGSYKTLDVITLDSLSQRVPLTGNFSTVIEDYQNMQFNGTPALIGQGNLQSYFTLAGLACCNQSTPYADALSKAGSAFFLDQAANSVLDANKALMLAFGSTHLLTFNENNNINLDNGLVKHIVIPDPVYPQLKWDFDFKWDECTKSWIFFISVYNDIFNLFQADSFNDDDDSPDNSPACSDELLGVTGIWGYNFT
jgi:hypothetical protein